MLTGRPLTDRLQQQLAFINELEELKAVRRRNRTLDSDRHENSAEHSWHVALMALLLLEYAESEPAPDPLRVVKMLLVHDLVEIDAGDTWLYDQDGAETKNERETASADRLFALLPGDQARAWRKLWDEFEHGLSADARFAAAIDALQPLLNHLVVHERSAAVVGDDRPTQRQVAANKAHIAEVSAVLWELAQQVISESTEQGLYDEG